MRGKLKEIDTTKTNENINGSSTPAGNVEVEINGNIRLAL